MLLSLTGASGSEKSTVLALLDGRDWGVEIRCVEFDSIGVPEGADTAWRHAAIEHWVEQALAAERDGAHMLLCGQIPMGELIATPSADQLSRIRVCMLDCSPEARSERLRNRGVSDEAIPHHVQFGRWFRSHTMDPTHAPEVIRVDSAVPMRWSRWADWTRGAEGWQAEIIDTDELAPWQTADAVERWIRQELASSPHT